MEFKDDYYQMVNDETSILINTFTVEDNNIIISDDGILDNYSDNLYDVSLLNDDFVLNIKENLKVKSIKQVPSRSQAYQEHASGIDGNIVYINDLTMDYDYYMGLNYTTSSNYDTPTMEDKEIYTNQNLVKFQIIYHGDLDSNHVGTISYENGENQSQIIYYKYYYVSGNTIDIELIDNPFAGRPQGMAFNGWITDDNDISMYLDQTYYTWHAVIPMNGESSKVVEFYASWTEATMARTSDNSNNINTTIGQLNDAEMTLANVIVTIPHYDDIINNDRYYYTSTTIRNGSSQVGYYDASGTALTGTCRSNRNCTVYIRQTAGSPYVATENYFYSSGGSMHSVDPRPVTYTYEANDLYTGMNMAGFYEQKTISGSRVGYVDENGAQLTGTCNNCTVYERILYYDENDNENIVDINKDYYYLVTRDTNFVYLNSYSTTASNNYWTNTRPFTLTSYYYDTSYSNPIDSRSSAYYNTQTYMNIQNDTRIEYIRMYSSQSSNESDSTTSSSLANTTNVSGYIYGRNKNLKIGRGITRRSTSYMSAIAITGGYNNTSSVSNAKYKLIVESGNYTYSGVVSLRANATLTNPDIYAIYGSDYDRVNDDNSKLEIAKTLYADMASRPSCTPVYTNGTTLIIKSGAIGSFLNTDDNTNGIYTTSNSRAVTSCHQTLIIEGGRINNIYGGPGPSDSMANYNAVTIYFKGGEAETIFGGGAYLTSNGNRIIQISGGRVNYSVAGGSNGYKGNPADGSTYIATLAGDAYVYAGGNSTIGNSNFASDATKFEMEWGSIFGTANGKPSVYGNNGNVTSDNSTCNKINK